MAEISVEELAEIKLKVRKMLDEKFQELGQDQNAFMQYLVDEFCEAARRVADAEERLRLGKGDEVLIC